MLCSLCCACLGGEPRHRLSSGMCFYAIVTNHEKLLIRFLLAIIFSPLPLFGRSESLFMCVDFEGTMPSSKSTHLRFICSLFVEPGFSFHVPRWYNDFFRLFRPSRLLLLLLLSTYTHTYTCLDVSFCASSIRIILIHVWRVSVEFFSCVCPCIWN